MLTAANMTSIEVKKGKCRRMWSIEITTNSKYKKQPKELCHQNDNVELKQALMSKVDVNISASLFF